MLPKAASATGVMAASAPPASTASQRPVAIRRWPARIECVPDAQAVVIVSHGPRQPRRIETVAPPAFAIIIGTRNGETRRGPFSSNTPIWASIVLRPPTPVPI